MSTVVVRERRLDSKNNATKVLFGCSSRSITRVSLAISKILAPICLILNANKILCTSSGVRRCYSFVSNKTMTPRGALIVFEGVDKSGKSTQTQLLTNFLKENGHRTELMKFPDRTGPIGSAIDLYLRKKSNLSDEAIHLLFSSDRWEAAPRMLEYLKKGTTLIVDRYAFSGVAYSAAKGLNYHWCRQPDVGLPKPDGVFFLDIPPSSALSREGYGDERYEKLTFQQKVYDVFTKLRDPTWTMFNAEDNVDVLHKSIRERGVQIIEQSKMEPILHLWKNDETGSNGHTYG